MSGQTVHTGGRQTVDTGDQQWCHPCGIGPQIQGRQCGICNCVVVSISNLQRGQSRDVCLFVLTLCKYDWRGFICYQFGRVRRVCPGEGFVYPECSSLLPIFQRILIVQLLISGTHTHCSVLSITFASVMVTLQRWIVQGTLSLILFLIYVIIVATCNVSHKHLIM